MLDDLRQRVRDANVELARRGLAISTWGNASAIDRDAGVVVIKPSGVPYKSLRPEDMAVVDLDEALVEGALRPSSDTATHLVLYKAFKSIGAIVHTHSHFATCWAQACRPIPCLGTTHADYFHREVPVTRELTPLEINNNYEFNTGQVIVRAFQDRDPMDCPAILVANHAPFVWGATIEEAVENATVLEAVARMALHTLQIDPRTPSIPRELIDKHFMRKHGPDAYYGQREP